jgi:hypothetical protein
MKPDEGQSGWRRLIQLAEKCGGGVEDVVRVDWIDCGVVVVLPRLAGAER